MPIDFPAAPSPGDPYSYGGKNYRRMNGYWSAVSQFAPAAAGEWGNFQIATSQNYYETLVTPAGFQPVAVAGVLLQSPP